MAKFFTPFERKRVSMSFSQPSLTEQSYKDECDIDFIISNFVKTGIDPNEGKKMSFVDCTQVKDFQDAQNIVAETKSMFHSLPAVVRDEFGTVENYLEYVSNPQNLKDCYERELIDPSSVDVKDVYPEKYIEQPKVVESPVVEPSVVPPTTEKVDTTT